MKNLNQIFKRAFLVGILGAFLALNAHAEEIKVLAAASLKYVLEEIKGDFLKNKSDKIEISYISSGKAFAQIKNGAPVHLFVSADVNYPAKLHKEGLAEQKEQIYAKGKLVLWSNDENFKLKDFKDILNSKVTHISIPNPKVAPYGKASIEALKNMGFLQNVESKFVMGESIGAATTYVESKSAQIGFSAKSMFGKSGINTPQMSIVEIDEKLYTPIAQALVVTKYGKDSALAKAFKDYILSDYAKQRFLEFGYSVE